MRALALALLLAATATAPVAAADDLAVDAAAVRACHEGAAPRAAAPACIGAEAGRCQAMPGGASTLGIVRCLSLETAAWDDLLNREYGLLRAALADDDAAGMAQDVSRATALRDAQRAWIAFRDADCRLEWAIWQDGTIRGPVAADCHLARTAGRALELRDLRRDAEGDR